MITLKDIRHNKFAGDHKFFKSVKEFLGAFKGDIDEIIATHEIMYQAGTDLDAPDKRILDKSLGTKYGTKYFFKATFNVNGLLAEFFGEQETYIMLPIMLRTKNVISIKGETILAHFFREMVKSGYISDKYYLTISPILKSFPLGYNTSTGYIGFIEKEIKEVTKYSQEVGTHGKKKGELTVTGGITLEEVLEQEIKQGYVNKDIGDPNREYAYGHSLRKSADYHMLQWSRKVTIDWKKINVVAASKGSGKSYYGALLCAKELFKEARGFGGRKIRQIKYFVPDLNNVGSSIMDYMEGFLHNFIDKKLPNGKSIIEISTSKFSIKCNLTGTTFRMISLYNFGKGAIGEGLACDFAVIDEAAYIPDAFWTLFSQRALIETESMYIVTTITGDTPRDHWFYRLLIDGELGDELISSHRVDILNKQELYELDYKRHLEAEDYESIQLMHKELKKVMDFTINDLKKTGLKEYYARAFCVILDESQVFNITGNIVDPIENKPEDYYILGVDFGGNADPGSLVLFNISKATQTESREMNGIHYLDQVKEAKKYRERFKNLIIVGDATTIGRVIMQEDKENVIDYWVQFVGQGDWSWNQKGFYVSSKKHMVDMANLLLDKGIVKIQGNQDKMITQMKNFVKISGTKSLIAKYQGKGTSHDDLVDGLLLISFVVVTILGLRELKELQDYGTEFDNEEQYQYNEANYNNNSLYTYSLNTY